MRGAVGTDRCFRAQWQGISEILRAYVQAEHGGTSLCSAGYRSRSDGPAVTSGVPSRLTYKQKTDDTTWRLSGKHGTVNLIVSKFIRVKLTI